MAAEPFGGIPEPFCLLDAVLSWDRDGLWARRRFEGAPVWQALEAAAQACAMHQRVLSGFKRHAFLLSVRRFPLHPARLDGRFAIHAEVLGQSGTSASYGVQLACGQLSLEGRLAIGLAPYGGRFQEAQLVPHFKERWQCLSK